MTSAPSDNNSTNNTNKASLPKECIVLLEELTKQFYDNSELNTSKIQVLFVMFSKVNFDFTRLNNVIDIKLYQKLYLYWEIYANKDKLKNSDSPAKKFNNIDNLIEYKNKLLEMTKQHKQQQNITYDKEVLRKFKIENKQK